MHVQNNVILNNNIMYSWEQHLAWLYSEPDLCTENNFFKILMTICRLNITDFENKAL